MIKVIIKPCMDAYLVLAAVTGARSETYYLAKLEEKNGKESCFGGRMPYSNR